MAQPGKSSKSKQKTQALSLLDGILEDTKREASNEEARLKRELEEKRARARAAAEKEEQRKRDETQRRIDEELARRQAADERRAAAAEALRIEELKEKGLWKEPVVEQAPAPKAAPVSLRPVQTTGEVIAASKSSKLPMIAAAAVVLALGAAGATYVVLGNQEFVDTTTTYSRVDVSTIALADSSQAVGFRPIPTPEPVAAAVAPEETGGRSNRDRRDRGRDHSSSSSSRHEEAAPPRLQLGGAIGGH